MLHCEIQHHAGPAPDTGRRDAAFHEPAVILATVHTDGMVAVARTMLRARSGDRVAQSLTAGELLRALPGTGWLAAHDLLQCTRIGDEERLCDLTPAQRGGLVHLLARV